ncbi:MAG: hypothetical protein JST62_09055 [Bacteroidetes bacterium]|nr:hypothetical protein [Bacteroidota bacterium]
MKFCHRTNEVHEHKKNDIKLVRKWHICKTAQANAKAKFYKRAILPNTKTDPSQNQKSQAHPPPYDKTYCETYLNFVTLQNEKG